MSFRVKPPVIGPMFEGQSTRLGDRLNSPAASAPEPVQSSGSAGHRSAQGLTGSRRLHRKQAAAYMGVSLSWLDKSRLRGDGPVYLQIGGRIAYDTTDLDDYLKRCRRRSTARPP
ncbi:helix-turn-helix transcriptional regulator [Aestuariivirga sp.]|uniref:helix-turn-helix transcriptional regulator n=1 Tax=Aestuariivirga sp. TaxID=2650926 RepID=UPI003918C625